MELNFLFVVLCAHSIVCNVCSEVSLHLQYDENAETLHKEPAKLSIFWKGHRTYPVVNITRYSHHLGEHSTNTSKQSVNPPVLI
jgi:hypothetical protein